MTSKIVPIEKYQDRFAAIAQSDDDFPVDFDEAWKWIGYSTKGAAKLVFGKAGFADGVDFRVFNSSIKNPKGGRPTQKIMMTVDCFKQLCMMSGTERGKQIRLYFIEIEKRYKTILHNDSPMPHWAKEIMLKLANAQELISGKANQRFDCLELGQAEIKEDISILKEEVSVLKGTVDAIASDRYSDVVYFIVEEVTGYIKIGHCNKYRIQERIDEIQGIVQSRLGIKSSLTVLLTMPGDEVVEDQHHKMFEEYNVKKAGKTGWGKEFFLPGERLLNYIKKRTKKFGYPRISSRRKFKGTDEFIQASLF